MCKYEVETGQGFYPSCAEDTAGLFPWRYEGSLEMQACNSTQKISLIQSCETQKVPFLVTSQETHFYWQQEETEYSPQKTVWCKLAYLSEFPVFKL